MRYVFADCILDTTLATLHRAGRAIPVRPKVFRLLQYLLEQRDHLVAKDTLCAQVWPTQYISDATLEGCLTLARQAIGDSGHAQRLIQTRRGYGYRFVGAVEIQAVGSTEVIRTAPEGALVPSTVPSSQHAPERLAPALPLGEPGVELAGAGVVALERPAAGGADGERKLVTLLGCILAHPVALPTRLELDALHSRMRLLYTLVRREIDQYGGTLHHIAGDRLLAVFGAPLAYEDHGRRAVLAALGVLQRLAECQEVDGEAREAPLLVRLGLHTGFMIVGGLGEAREPGTVVVGDLPVAVEALQANAAPGTLLCSDVTARLVLAEAHLEPHGPVPVPGQPTPLLAYRVLAVYPRDVPVVPHGGRAESPFVGRTQAMGTLHALLAQVEAGRGQVVGIVGEPGIGKSRLLAEFRHSLRGRQLRYLQGRCLSYGQATPYLPILDLLRHFFGLTAADSPEGITTKIHHKLREVGMAPEEAAGYLLALLGVETGAAALGELSPEVRKAHTFATLVQLCLQGSQAGPLILAVEDLHWSDVLSAEWLTALVERMGHVPLLVLGTYRPGYRPAWLDKSYATQIALPPLSSRDSLCVVQALVPLAQRPAALEQAILTKADGNPFFLEELAQTVVEQGGRTLALGVPDTVHAVLATRIDRLPPEEKRLLQTAAVIGTEVSLPLLQSIAEVPEAVVGDALSHLQAAEFLYETHLIPERVYTFKHALTHEVAYSSLLLERRRTLHAQIVEALEALARDHVTEQVERLAYHALRSEVWERALLYCQQAGEKAMRRAAYREAVGYYEQALSALQHLPETRATHEQAIDLRLVLRSALLLTGNFGRILAVLREAEALAVTLDDPRRLGQVSGLLSVHFNVTGAYAQAIAAGERARMLATAHGDRVLYASANRFLGAPYQARGDYRRAIDCYRKTVVAIEEAQHHELFGLPLPPAILSYALLAWCHAELGKFAEGRAMGEDGLRIAEKVTHPASLIVASWGVGLLSLHQGNLPMALPHLERAMGICQDMDIPFYVPMVAPAVGAAYTLCGRIADAVPLLTQALEQTMATAMVGYQARCRLPLGEAQMWAGRLEEAHSHAEQTLALTCTHQERGYQAYALRLLGDIAARREPLERAQAEIYYQQALALADELGMRPLQAHCHHALGTLYATTSQREQARVALATAIDLYRAMDMIFWLPQAEAVLAQVEAGGYS